MKKLNKKQTPKLKTSTRLGSLTQLEMTLRDIKKEVIIRGMPFQEVVSADVPNLYSWWNNNRDAPINKNLLDDFDDWLEEELTAIGRADLIHSNFRFNYLSKGEESQPQKVNKIISPPKKRREKNKLGLYAGTKKAMVYEAQQKGWSVKKTIRKVQRAFPDALEKSIKIWYNKASKLQNG